MRVKIVHGAAVAPAEAVGETEYCVSTPQFEVAGRTDIGRRRANNEDNFAVAADVGLFVLSDGMGGEAAGELASKIGVEEVFRHMREAARNPSLPLIGDKIEEVSPITNQLASAIRRANRVIWEAAKSHPSQRGMGATVVAAMLRPPFLGIAHVGDSRIYVLRSGELKQETQDHSLVMEQVRRGLITLEQAEKSDMQNIIIRALGAEENVKVDVNDLLVSPGDRILLCSDGLTRMIPDSGITQVLTEAATVRQACDRLIDIANENGGEDNITVLIVGVREPRASGFWARLKKLFS